MIETRIDAITLEVMKNAFHTIAEEMGVTLIRTSLSTNIKDRMDCSTAIYTREGQLVAQAEHVPLHLGLMPSVVEEVLKIYPPEELKEGDAILINDPYISGSHLPDIFMISPVFYQGKLSALAANIAHHVDVGGQTPGSMSVKATEIFQEGLRIPAIRVRKAGILDDEVIRLLASNVRTGKEVIGDIYAQLAANNVAEARLKEMFEKYTFEHTEACMKEIIEYSDRRLRVAIKKVSDGIYEFEDYLEGDGISENLIKVRAKIIIQDEEVTVDFTGSSKQANGPVNSTHGVTSACVYYAIKSILDPEVPPNAGTYRSIKIIAPKGTIVNPNFPAAVSNANANTSQRITDAILGAMAKVLPERSMAACSGTMSGIAIGGFNAQTNEYFSYVETYGGGQSAVNGLDGMDGVHTNMTNTLNTPVEVIEQTFPILVNKYALVDSSSGAGKYRGGMGLTRAMTFLEDGATITLMTDRQKMGPWGLLGGREGKTSACTLINPEGEKISLSSKVTMEVPKNSTIIIETAGGGGYYDPLDRELDFVLDDVIKGNITAGEAANLYGVIVSDNLKKVDYDETLKKRALLKSNL